MKLDSEIFGGLVECHMGRNGDDPIIVHLCIDILPEQDARRLTSQAP